MTTTGAPDPTSPRSGAPGGLWLGNVEEWARVLRFLEGASESPAAFTRGLRLAAYETADPKVGAALTQLHGALSAKANLAEALAAVGFPRLWSVSLGVEPDKRLGVSVQRLSRIHALLQRARALPPGGEGACRLSAAALLRAVFELIEAGQDADAALGDAVAFFGSAEPPREDSDALETLLSARTSSQILHVLFGAAAPDPAPSRGRLGALLLSAADAFERGIWSVPALLPGREREVASTRELAALLYWAATLLQVEVQCERAWAAFPQEGGSRIDRICQELVEHLRERRLPIGAALSLIPEMPQSALEALDTRTPIRLNVSMAEAAKKIHEGVFRAGPRRATDAAATRRLVLRE